MLGNVKAAVWFFLLGLTFGLFTAPRSGRATRRMMARRINSILSVSPQEILAPTEEPEGRFNIPGEEMPGTITQPYPPSL